jgi:hypothetical protein
VGAAHGTETPTLNRESSVEGKKYLHTGANMLG